MKANLTVALLPLAMLALLIPSAIAQSNGATQIVFSVSDNPATTGVGNFAPPPNDPRFGFWYWCTPNGYQGKAWCDGAVYIYGLQHNSVEVFCPGSGCVTLNSDGSYTLHAIGSNGWNCYLTNTPPAVSGPHNTVTMTCTNPPGTGSTSNAVVNIT